MVLPINDNMVLSIYRVYVLYKMYFKLGKIPTRIIIYISKYQLFVDTGLSLNYIQVVSHIFSHINIVNLFLPDCAAVTVSINKLKRKVKKYSKKKKKKVYAPSENLLQRYIYIQSISTKIARYLC